MTKERADKPLPCRIECPKCHNGFGLPEDIAPLGAECWKCNVQLIDVVSGKRIGGVL